MPTFSTPHGAIPSPEWRFATTPAANRKRPKIRDGILLISFNQLSDAASFIRNIQALVWLFPIGVPLASPRRPR